MADSLFVIDSRFLLETSHNAFHGAPLLQDSKGRDTTMLFGFARDLLCLRKQLGMRTAGMYPTESDTICGSPEIAPLETSKGEETRRRLGST
jgi:hypothetical protein